MEGIKITQQIKSRQTGLRIDQAAAELFPDYSRARLQSWIRDGSLTLEGATVRPKQRVSGGEILRLEAEPDLDGTVLPQDIPLDIIEADEHIIVLNKPAGLVVHPAAGNRDGTLQNGLLYFDSALAGVPRAGIVHRLDKDTTGVMVVARSLKAHSRLVAQLQDRSMGRIYEAVVHGQVRAGGTVNAPIARNPHDRLRMAVVASGRPAVSHYRLLKTYQHFSQLRVSLESGRTHQIRVHMQHLGFPVIGDPQYGRKTGKSAALTASVFAAVNDFPRQALHARMLKLVHPGSLERCEFEAPIPADLAGLLQTLESEDS